MRLCDGRYFPLQPHPTASPSQLCSAFCPATQTRIFRGNEIQNAVGQDGSRYQELKNAFLYRKQSGRRLHLQRQGFLWPRNP